jgi:hypothetical protein
LEGGTDISVKYKRGRFMWANRKQGRIVTMVEGKE